ncbi:hypothetical protein ACIO02_33890 [Streptomyces sp. NPDC087568]|uniref:hypothetical protein n=1 Tax=Streptomyces sp. NPDC087568 TaxID=3365799 RepID=UPI003814B090
MAQDSWPSPSHNNRAISDTEYEKIAAKFSGDGVYGSPADDPVVSAGTGLQVNIRANVEASVRGHAWTSGTSTVVLPIAPNSSGQTRTDRIVLRLDRATWTVRAVPKQGTPGGSAPALTQQTGDTGVYEVLLAGVTVPSGANSVTVTRGELYVGGRIRPCTSAHRNPNPVVGEMCFETDTGLVRVWNGTAWQLVSGDSGEVKVTSALSGWSSISDSVLEKRAGTVHLRLGTMQRSSSAMPAGVDMRLPVMIPAAYRHRTRDQYVLAYIGGGGIGRILIYAANTDRAGQAWMLEHPQVNSGVNIIPESGVSWVVD